MKCLYRACISLWFCGFIFPPGVFAQPQKLYLNPATAGAAAQSKFVEITRFIPIDPLAGNINTNIVFYITKKYWVFFDYSEKKLYFFTKEASFIKKIDLKKFGDPSIIYDDRKELLKFNIRNKNYILTNTDLVKIRAKPYRKANQKYFKSYEIDLRDELLQVQASATDPYFIGNARWFYDDYYYRSNLQVDTKAKDTLGYELEILQNNKPVQSFFPFNKTGNPVFRYPAMASSTQLYLSFTDTAAVVYTSRPFHPTIFRLGNNGIEPLYEIVLPVQNALPEVYRRNGFKSKAEWENFQNSNGAVFLSINGIKNLRKYLFFGVRSLRSYESYLYDKDLGRFYKTKMIKADSSQYNIPLLQNGLGQYNNGHYYTLVPASSFLDFYNKNKEKNISYPPSLEAYLQSATKNGNPVMVEYKLKD